MFSLLFAVAFTLIILYCALIIIFFFAYISHKSETQLNNTQPILFSIIVVARNEEKNISYCLNSIKKTILQSNAHHELILVDDNSTDATLALLKNFKNEINSTIVVELAQYKLTTKKEALKKAVSFAKNKWLIFTDADCIVSKNWLTAYQNKITTSNAKLIAGAVSIYAKNSFLNAFQQLDMFSMTGSACSAIALQKPILCNGANLAVEKQIFIDASTTAEYAKKASGDDVFLLFYVAKTFGANSIYYLKQITASIETFPQQTWQQVWQQRKRWISKSTVYYSPFMVLISLLVYISNLSILLLACFSILLPEKKTYFFFAFIAKSLTDFIFLFSVAIFFRKTSWLIWFIPVQILHVLYISIIPLLSIKSKYTWKGRKLK